MELLYCPLVNCDVTATCMGLYHLSLPPLSVCCLVVLVCLDALFAGCISVRHFKLDGFPHVVIKALCCLKFLILSSFCIPIFY
jgi:hypothetical protein